MGQHGKRAIKGMSALLLVAMNLSIFSAWMAVGGDCCPRLTLQESAALILLASSLLVFRTFRERYLLA
jgi:hypothetical protein